MSKSVTKTIGIDLGTTNCAVATVDKFDRPVIVPNADGANVTPSVICFKDGEVHVGDDARELKRVGEPDVIEFFKRHIGDPHFFFAVDGREYSPTDLSAILLRKLKEDAELELGCEIRNAVITVPAYFRNPQRAATIAAGEAVGLNILQVINEPTAAAIAYGHGGSDTERLILVYDLGGGTFDVTLLRLGPKGIRVLTSDGDRELGGKDWDMRIVEYLGNAFQDEFGKDPFDDAETTADIVLAAEDAKKRLSSVEKTVVTVRHGSDRTRLELTRSVFEEITGDLMHRTVSLTEAVLQSQDLEASDLDEVLLVGGSTRMQMVGEFVRTNFGRPVAKGVNVDEVVAQGAAIVAANAAAQTRGELALPGALRNIDVTNHSLGMIALNADRSEYINSIVLPKNVALPNTSVRPYKFSVRGSEQDLEIYMTQGESEQPGEVTYLGKYVVKKVPSAGNSNADQVVQVEYTYDVSDTVNVAATVKATGQALDVVVEPLPDNVPHRFMQAPDSHENFGHTIAYLVIDVSGSMSGAPLQEAKKAALGFLGNLDLAHCSMGLLSFSDSTTINLEACQDARKIERAIEGLSIGGGTSARPFDDVLRLLKDQGDARFAVVLTDGQWFKQDAAIASARQCSKAAIDVVAIGFGSADESFLRAIASKDEAALFTDLGELVGTFENIAQVVTAGGGLTMLDAVASAEYNAPGRSFISSLFRKT